MNPEIEVAVEKPETDNGMEHIDRFISALTPEEKAYATVCLERETEKSDRDIDLAFPAEEEGDIEEDL